MRQPFATLFQRDPPSCGRERGHLTVSLVARSLLAWLIYANVRRTCRPRRALAELPQPAEAAPHLPGPGNTGGVPGTAPRPGSPRPQPLNVLPPKTG